jgi:Uma2 family endonuclease
MTLVANALLFTPEDLLALPDGVSYELVDGKLVERNMGMESSQIGVRITLQIGKYLEDHPLGLLFGADAGYRCFPDAPEKVRKPDVSFIKFGRLEEDRAPKGHCSIPPDLAVEVLSPKDLVYDVEEKVDEYMRAGVRLIWIVSPRSRTVRIHRQPSSPRGSFTGLSSDQPLDGEDVLPGFSCKVGNFFEAR